MKEPKLLFDGVLMRKALEDENLKKIATDLYDNKFCKKEYGDVSDRQKVVNKQNHRHKSGGVYGIYDLGLPYAERMIIGLNNSHTAVVFMFEKQFLEHSA